MEGNGVHGDPLEANFQRRQAVRRKGFVWQKTQTLVRIAEDHRRGVTEKPRDLDFEKFHFKRSSLDLAPSLLSLYDSIASASKATEDECQSDQISPSNQTSPSNQIISQEVDDDQIQCDLSHSRMCEGTNNNEDKKRPLSISSMSSSSSLPRNSPHKRPNLCQFDRVILGRSDMEKLDSLLFIDDDAPSVNTDEEMSVDTDGESGRKCDKDGASLQSSASLSSSEPPHTELVSTTDNNLDLSDIRNSCGDQNNNSPVTHSFDNSDNKTSQSVTPVTTSQSVTPLTTPQGVTPVTRPQSVTPVTTPLSRHSSVSRDATSPTKYVTYVQRVVAEIIETERIYVKYLKEIIDGYLEFLGRSSELRLSEKQRECLFGNILEIYEFSRNFLSELEECGDDPLKVAACFVKNNSGFSIYAQYCTNYPSAIEVLTGVMMHPEMSEIIKKQQVTLGHNLPLGAYLLKPVQRVLKYHLLLHNLLKNYNKKDPGREILSQALDHMTGMAQHINEMKRKHEHAVRVQEIQSQLEEYEGEDLTRLGELVLEGSFRIYGAKTSRHVFLFEKCVLIAKRKEDSMLSCKTFIMCSNLMLVESIPKEPLSFQVIPFDNPRGQHMLQARNLDQKRKWCQEIKRLIIESYKDKIPEKVKGLVMQLGKSREEESAKPEDLEPKKFHHHTAPEYLEKRQRMRRKSGGGTLLPDILKPQRRKQRRGESVSPRVSPILQRKAGLLQSADTTEHKDSEYYTEDSLSRDNTYSDISSIATIDSDPSSSRGQSVSRSHSFKSAVTDQPLMTLDYEVEETDLNEVARNLEKTSRRTRSFRMATRLKPLRSIDLEDENISSSSQNTHLSDQDQNMNQHRASLDTSCEDSERQCGVNNGLSRSDGYSSMPSLSQTDRYCDSPLSDRRKAESRSSASSSRRESTESFKALGNFQQSKRIIDTKQYFSLSASNSTENCDNLRRDGNTVTAFNDSFLKKSLENVSPNSPVIGPRSPKLSLIRPLPLTSALQKSLQSTAQNQSSECSSSGVRSENGHKDTLSSASPSEENPWIPISDNLHKKVITNSLRTRSHSTDCELDNGVKHSFDWLVYANRNDLPVTGFSMDDIPKLYRKTTQEGAQAEKYSSMDESNFKYHNYAHQNFVQSYATPPRSSMDPVNIQKYNEELSMDPVNKQKYNNELRHSLPPSISSDESDMSSTADTLPSLIKKPVQLHGALTRSNSTPCARMRPPVFRSTRASSVDIENVMIDHEMIVAEMEAYMKKSDSNATLNSSNSRFPTSFQVIHSGDEAEEECEEPQRRDSTVSNYSSSSYESHDSFENPNDVSIGVFESPNISILDSSNGQSDNVIDLNKNKNQGYKANVAYHRRSGSYDNKINEDGMKGESEIQMRNASRSSLLSLNSWFSSKSKVDKPDLHSVLHAGELGGTGIGQRMAEPEPIYEGFPKALDNQEQGALLHCNDDYPNPSNRLSKDSSSTQLPTIQNLNIQQCDSALSIGDEICNLEDSPRNENIRRNSDSSSGSFYERQFSMALADGEAFRDSAVYCEMEVDHQDTATEVPKSQRLPIKAYVQKLEEITKPAVPVVNKVTARQPGDVVRKRMESLQNNALYRKSVSRSTSEERELKACSYNRSRSRPVSEERELLPITPKPTELSPLLAKIRDKELTPPLKYSSMKDLSSVSSSRSSQERELSPFSSGARFLRSSTPCREDRPLRREQSDIGYTFRSRSNTPGSGRMKSSLSLGRLDNIGNDVDTLVNMKGWVRQLIQKFQTTTNA